MPTFYVLHGESKQSIPHSVPDGTDHPSSESILLWAIEIVLKADIKLSKMVINTLTNPDEDLHITDEEREKVVLKMTKKSERADIELEEVHVRQYRIDQKNQKEYTEL